jgi:hypothetical protein
MPAPSIAEKIGALFVREGRAATMAASLAVRDRLPGFCGKAAHLAHRSHGEAAPLVRRT